MAPLPKEMIMRESLEGPHSRQDSSRQDSWQGDGGSMTSVTDTTDSRGEAPTVAVEVWDQVVRVLYGSLAVYLVLAYATGGAAGRVHIIAGITIAIHVALRIVWGLVRQSHAASAGAAHQLPASASAAERHSALRRFARHPAGAALIGAFLTDLGSICLTGAAMSIPALRAVRWLHEVHATLASVAIGLVVLYVVGALVTGLSDRESFPRPMLPARKRR
jgi:cytochrome b